MSPCPPQKGSPGQRRTTQPSLGSEGGVKPFQRVPQPLDLHKALPQCFWAGGGLSSAPHRWPSDSPPTPRGALSMMTGTPRGQSGSGAGCEGRGSQSQGALENSKTTATAVVKAVSTARGVLAGELRGAHGQRPGSKSPLPEYPRPPGDTRGRDVPEVSHRNLSWVVSCGTETLWTINSHNQCGTIRRLPSPHPHSSCA